MFLLFYEYHSGLLSLFTGVDMDGDELFSTLQYSLILFFKKKRIQLTLWFALYSTRITMIIIINYCYLLVGKYTIVYTPT